MSSCSIELQCTAILEGTGPPREPRKAGVYAVAIGFKPGLYETWDEVNAQVRGYPGAKHKKFGTRQEATGWLAESGVDLDASSKAAQRRSCSPEPRPRERNHGQERVPTATARKVTVPNTNTSTQPSLPVSQVRDLETDRAAFLFNNVSPSPLSPILADIAKKGFSFSKSSPHHLIVYTDGSARGNGQVGSKAGAGVWWGSQGEASKSNWAERVPGHPQTNNRGELLAVIRAIERCPYPDLPLEVRCDSRYSISCMTVWLPKWVEKGFKGSRGEPVMNVDLIKHLMTIIRRRGPNAPVRFKHVSAHSGIIGNEEADRLAKTGGALPDVKDRGEWLDLDLPEEPQDNKLISVDTEIDERWLMSAEEIDLLERDLAEGDRGVGRDS
ncbi:hypothetical protein I350_02093 [Cryptococcus amylolentus CBS 6273]|uniref:ribonuclease H n=1 Tax=Cryptococcus amylolentus CBS 6273 TaxID=1296118 RepID=A0A1E3K9Z2_9TREE|nr:hypothetical protein I350_02093 [Cryptococcus amylolentus CBS 6273]